VGLFLQVTGRTWGGDGRRAPPIWRPRRACVMFLKLPSREERTPERNTAPLAGPGGPKLPVSARPVLRCRRSVRRECGRASGSATRREAKLT